MSLMSSFDNGVAAMMAYTDAVVEIGRAHV